MAILDPLGSWPPLILMVPGVPWLNFRFFSFLLVALLLCQRVSCFLVYKGTFDTRESSETPLVSYVLGEIWITWCVFALILFPPALAGILYDCEKPVRAAYYLQLLTFWLILLLAALVQVFAYFHVAGTVAPKQSGEGGSSGDGTGVNAAGVPTGTELVVAAIADEDNAAVVAKLQESKVKDPIEVMADGLFGVLDSIGSALLTLVMAPFGFAFPDSSWVFIIIYNLILSGGHLFAAWTIRSAADEIREGFFREFWDYKKRFARVRGTDGPGEDPLLDKFGRCAHQSHILAVPMEQARKIRDLPREFPIEHMVDTMMFQERTAEAQRAAQNAKIDNTDRESDLTSAELWTKFYVQENSIARRLIPTI
ncbi:unnamed protein product [Amoebophrya sp. A120]|nr:unnamed protein product [Amoebophrya sp. A120]|eukprot:GSA120T00015048001.1